MVNFPKSSTTHRVAQDIPLHAEPDHPSNTEIAVAARIPTLANHQGQADDVFSHRTHVHVKTNFNKFSKSNNSFQRMSASLWTCCQSGDVNTFALAPERCSVCGHPRCAQCS
ncbi:hypothetical protein PENSTE_c015G08192 [Penicillium steckii]|uniref:Uncharacterized protein n=1 Tax=Penicillium steckii TaxID=303698 RepID=A0A1V6T0L1_9EURO|nr:hypothetical protein PENSTE_c015G08192 [Penicillium steckii]